VPQRSKDAPKSRQAGFSRPVVASAPVESITPDER
jgi:hypothetical protein